LHEEAHTERGYTASNVQRCFAIRTGIHGLLDMARKTYCELVNEITGKKKSKTKISFHA
jgi:DNA mismatch repair protein MSH4